MQLKAIKDLVAKPISELESLEEKLMEGESLDQEIVAGSDEGEQLTHLSAAIWVLKEVEKNGSEAKTEIRNFMSRVRNSIS